MEWTVITESNMTRNFCKDGVFKVDVTICKGLDHAQIMSLGGAVIT
jgi:hypothetical protein